MMQQSRQIFVVIPTQLHIRIRFRLFANVFQYFLWRFELSAIMHPGLSWLNVTQHLVSPAVMCVDFSMYLMRGIQLEMKMLLTSKTIAKRQIGKL